jgi:ferric-dicitrate binding protein FerR (iron transport regulator)
MNYQDYDVEDFVMDISFQNYCLGKEDPDMLFWKAWVIDNPHKKEKVQEAKKLFILLNGNIDAHQFRRDAESFKTKLYQHLHKEENDNTLKTERSIIIPENYRRRRRLFLYTGGIAAALLLLLMLRYIRNDKPQSISNEASVSAKLIYASLPGERKSFQLPDGSTVLMNGGSSIEVSKDFNATNREISLKGEAYFNVTHNAQKPFIIHTDNINVKVLGTEFDVKAYPEDNTTETILIRGSVEITLHDKPEEKIILKPRHKLIVQNESAPIKKTSDSTVIIPKVIPEKIKTLNVTLNASDSTVMETSWKDNRLNFSDETLGEVAIKLERWYGVKVKVEGDIAQEYKFTGIFENETIDETLKALQLSLFFHYHIKNGKILITK